MIRPLPVVLTLYSLINLVTPTGTSGDVDRQCWWVFYCPVPARCPCHDPHRDASAQ